MLSSTSGDCDPQDGQLKDDKSFLSKWTFGLLLAWTIAVLFQAGYTFRLLYLKGRLKNFDLVIFYFYAVITLMSK
jgi:hypothetical protein